MKKRAIKAVSLLLALTMMLVGCGDASEEPQNTQPEESVSKFTGAVTIEYSAPADPIEEWNEAEWIWLDAETGNNTWAEFKKEFTLDTVQDSVKIKIACDNKYWIMVNGASVTVEGGLNRGPNEYDTYYDVLEIAPYLNEGENTIHILCWYWGNTGNMTHYITAGKPGLLVSSDLVIDGECLISKAGEWMGRLSPAYKMGGENPNQCLGEYNVIYDAREENDDGWSPAVKAGDAAYAGAQPWGNLIERPIPQFMDYGLVKENPAAAEVSLSEDGGTIYQLKLPYNMQIMPYIELGESTEAGRTITMYTETRNRSSLYAEYTTKEGTQEYESKGWINGDYLFFVIPEGVEILSIGYRQSGYAIEAGEETRYLGSFDSVLSEADSSFSGGHTWTEDRVSADNNFYDELWQKSADTLYVCMRDTFMDCPDRERGQYIGDVLNEIEESLYALGPSVNALSAKAIRQICAGQEAYEYEGRTYYSMSSLEPFPSTHEIQAQELCTAVAAELYYTYTGDTSLVVDCWQPLYNYLTNFNFMTGGDYAGTIRVRNDKELMQSFMVKNGSLGGWTDWGKNQDSRISLNAWWYMSAKAVRSMADVPGSGATQEQIEWLDTNMQKVEENFEKFWNPDLKAYATRFDSHWYKREEYADGTHLVDDRANALAVVSGLADPSHYEDIRNVFMGTEGTLAYENASIYMEKYVIQALYKMGYAEDAMTRLHDRYLEIANDKDSSTLPEFWNVSSMESTKNHGWSGGGLIALSHYAAGIEPTSPGYESFRICPQLGTFQRISATVPSEIGIISEVAERTDSGIVMTVNIPAGNAEIWVPIEEGQTVTVNAEAQEMGQKTAYGATYVVFSVTQPGEYIFSAK